MAPTTTASPAVQYGPYSNEGILALSQGELPEQAALKVEQAQLASDANFKAVVADEIASANAVGATDSTAPLKSLSDLKAELAELEADYLSDATYKELVAAIEEAEAQLGAASTAAPSPATEPAPPAAAPPAPDGEAEEEGWWGKKARQIKNLFSSGKQDIQNDRFFEELAADTSKAAAVAEFETSGLRTDATQAVGGVGNSIRRYSIEGVLGVLGAGANYLAISPAAHEVPLARNVRLNELKVSSQLVYGQDDLTFDQLYLNGEVDGDAVLLQLTASLLSLRRGETRSEEEIHDILNDPTNAERVDLTTSLTARERQAIGDIVELNYRAQELVGDASAWDDKNLVMKTLHRGLQEITQAVWKADGLGSNMASLVGIPLVVSPLAWFTKPFSGGRGANLANTEVVMDSLDGRDNSVLVTQDDRAASTLQTSTPLLPHPQVPGVRRDMTANNAVNDIGFERYGPQGWGVSIDSLRGSLPS